MIQLNWQKAMLVAVTIVCVSGISIAAITHLGSSMCRHRHMFNGASASRMHMEFKDGRGYGGQEMGPSQWQGKMGGDRRDDNAGFEHRRHGKDESAKRGDRDDGKQMQPVVDKGSLPLAAPQDKPADSRVQ